MKLSFSLASSKNPSKPSKSTACSSKDQDNQSPKKEFVTVFDSSLTLVDSNSKRTITIPPIPNEWNPQQLTKNIDLPIKSDYPNLKFRRRIHLSRRCLWARCNDSGVDADGSWKSGHGLPWSSWGSTPVRYD